MQENPSTEFSPVIRLFFQALFVFSAGLFLFLVLGLSSVLIDQIWYAGRVMPGISMNSVDMRVASDVALPDGRERLEWWSEENKTSGTTYFDLSKRYLYFLHGGLQ